MGSWAEIENEDPDFMRRARELLDVHKHKTLATIRRDGSPRISGTETSLIEGNLWFGSMWRSLKALDLLRDPRFALHGPTVDPSADWKGDVKFSGTASEVDDDHIEEVIAQGIEEDLGQYHLFRADIKELVVTSVAGSHLQIVVWKEGRGITTFKRK